MEDTEFKIYRQQTPSPTRAMTSRITKSIADGVYQTICVLSTLFLPISFVVKGIMFIVQYRPSYISWGRSSKSFYEENQQFLSSYFASNEEFFREYKNRYYKKQKAKELYLLILTELSNAVLIGNVNRVTMLSNFIFRITSIENKITLKDYYNNVGNPILNTNLVILACQYNKVAILKFLFNNKILKNLTVDIGRNDILPDDKDETGHNAFYYAMKSGNIELLDTLINKWPGNYFGMYCSELDEILSQTYEELKLKNIPLSEDIEIFVENELINLRFFSNVPKQNCKFEGNLDNIIERIELVLQNIDLLKAEYSNSEEVDQKFLFIAKFIAQNVHILKRQLKSTYNRLPWEEIEFCLICFISSHITQKEINLFYDFTLDKNKVLNHLVNFARILKHQNHVICRFSVDVGQCTNIPNLKREKVVEKIVSKYPEFEELYSDYQKIRDIHSLEKISSYIKLALSADPKQKEEQLIITRILQIVGEFFKNTLESPKLSNVTSEILLLSLPYNTREVIIDLRNSLSHAYSLFKRVEIENNKDIKFFIGIQNNLNKIDDMIVSMLYNNKIKIIRVLLTKILNSESIDEINEIAKMINNVRIESMFTDNFKKLEHEKLEKLIKDLSDNIADQTNYEKELFNDIYSIIKYSENKSMDARSNFITAFASLMALTTDLNDNNSNYNIRNKKSVATQVLENTSFQLKPQNFKKIVNLIMEIYSSAMPRMQSDTLDNISRLTYQIFWIVECSIDDIKWIKELKNKLKDKNSSIPFHKQSNVHKNKEQSYSDQLSFKLSELKKFLNKNDLNSKLIQNFSTYKNNKKLQAIVELLVLDIMSILHRSDKYLENNILFLDDYTPLLIGKCLRNHLAHDNVLVDVLLFDPSIAIILNAKKLISENIINCKQKIGKLIIDDPSRLKNKYESSLNTITNQEKMFAALEEGNLEDLKNCLKRGADMNARSINSWTALHYAAKGSSIEIIKYILVQDLSTNNKDVNGQTPLHIAAEHGRETIVEFFLREADTCVDNLDDSRKSALHIAAKNGHKETVKVLLKNNASTDTKDIIGFSPLHYAAQYNHIDIVKIMLEKEANVDINETSGFTLLHIAAENGYLELVNFLLKNKANVNARNDNGGIPLHAASMNGHLEVVNALISKGANVNATVIDGCTPLHYAIENGHENIANILLRHGAHVNAVDKTYNNTVLHYAAKDGHENIVKALLEYKANASIKTVNGLTPLHFAVRGGYLKIVAALLEFGVNIHTKDKSDTSPIYYAAESGHKEVVELLIKNGARINDKVFNYLTPLHVAAAKGHKDITELLIRNGARVTAQDIEGGTPLHSAASYGSTADIALLIKNKAEVDAIDYDGSTPLHLAALHGHESAIVLLIKNKAKINTKNNGGVTPLHAAIMGGHKHVVTTLLNIKSQVNVEEQIEGSTPLVIAVEGGHKEIVEILIANGANVNIKNKNKIIPLISAVKHNRKSIVEVLIENGANVNINNGEPLSLAVFAGYKDIVDILIKNRASIYKKYPENATLLHIAAMRNHKEIVNSLIAKGINVDAMTIHRLTALHLAAQDGQEEAARILIANGAMVNVVNIKNQTPLHLAATFGHVNIVEILLSNGAKIIVKDDKNRTPLELAVAHGHLFVVNMLLQYEIVDINAKGNDDWTILHIASQASNLEMVKYLVNRGSNIWARNSSGSLPIHIAAREGYKDTVEFFLSKGLNIYEIGAANQTLLHYAAINGKLEVVKYLIAQGAEVNARDVNGSTPMHIAADIDNKDVIEILLQNGAIYNHIDILFRRPIEIAKNKDVINLLASTRKLFMSVMFNNLLGVDNSIKTGAFVNARNIHGATSLHYAAMEGNDEIVKILLQNKANPNIVDSKGFTPIHAAANFSHLKIVKALLSYGATYNNTASKFGITPSDLATDRDITSLFKLISESFINVKENNVHVIYELNRIKDIETVKAVMGARDKENKTLVVAAIHDNFSKVEQLKQISQDGVSTQIALGLMLLDQGNYPEALRYFKSAFERRKTILGPDNPGTLDIQIHIATVLYKQGTYQEALTMYKEIFQKQKEILGLNHEDTLHTRSSIALVLHRQGNDEEAFNIYQKVYQKQKKKLGSNHPDTLNTQFHMALVLEKQGKYEEALNINKTVFEKRKETLGAHDIATVCAENNIAMVLASLGKYEESLKLYKEVFEKKKIILGINHTDTLRTLHNIAGVLFSQKKYHEALETFQEVLNFQKNSLQQNHPEILNTQYNIANTLFSQGKINSALKAFKEIYDQRKAIFGAKHPTVLDILNKIKTIARTLKFKGTDVSEVLQHLRIDINIAANEGDVQTVQRLINDGADVNDKDIDGRTPLHFAISNGHIDIVNILLQNSADVTQVTNKGNTPLHTATSKGYKEIVDILLNYISHDKIIDFVNAKTISSGTTSLHVAAKNGFFEIVKSLLKHGAIYNIKNKNDEVPIDLSEDQKIINLLKLSEKLFRDIKNDNVKAIGKLKVAKPDEFIALTNARNDQGNTLLQVAIANKHKNIAGEMLKMLKEF